MIHSCTAWQPSKGRENYSIAFSSCYSQQVLSITLVKIRNVLMQKITKAYHSTNVGNVIPQKTKNSVKTRTLILIILAISGDISSNPGPNQHQHASNKCNCRNQNLRPNSPDWMTDLSSHSKHIMIKLKNLQWSEVKKELHLKYLQQYKNSNIIPPGLNINKTPQIKYLKEHKKQIWENSLSNISKTLLDLLISQHSSDLKAINKQLKTSKRELKEANDIINHKESVDNW